MERLPARKAMAVAKGFLSGLSYDENAVRNGISKGTVFNVVAGLKAGKFPEAADLGDQIDLLRELSCELKRSGLTPGQCAIGLAVLARINECGLSPADIDHWPLILKSVKSEEEAQEFVRLIYSIQDAQKKTGLDLNDLDNKVREMERKAADLEPLTKQCGERRKQLADLTKQRQQLASATAGFEQKYNLLNPRVKDMEKREQDLSLRIKDLETRAEAAQATIAGLRKEEKILQELGLSLEELAEFRQGLQSIAQHHHVPPAGLRERLVHELGKLDEALGLEALIQSRKSELDKREQALALVGQEQESLKVAIADLKREKAGLEAAIRNTREKVSREIAQIIPLARDAINLLISELQRGHAEAMTETRRLKDETLEVGKEIGKLEEVLHDNQWLSELLNLAQGDESIEGSRVRAIVLLVLRGAEAWLKHHAPGNQAIMSLSYRVGSLIGEVEKWKP